MQKMKKLYQPAKKIIALLVFLVGIIIGGALFLISYKLLGLVIVIGVARALARYFALAQKIRARMSPRSIKKLSWLRFAAPLLDVVSLVSSLALLFIGGGMAVYAGFSPVPTSAVIGVLMMIAGGYTGAALSLFHERKPTLRTQHA